MNEFKEGDTCWSFAYSRNPLISTPDVVHVKLRKLYDSDGEPMVVADVIDSWATVNLFIYDLYKTKLDAVIALEKFRNEE